jgi:hypothetical protein
MLTLRYIMVQIGVAFAVVSAFAIPFIQNYYSVFFFLVLISIGKKGFTTSSNSSTRSRFDAQARRFGHLN